MWRMLCSAACDQADTVLGEGTQLQNFSVLPAVIIAWCLHPSSLQVSACTQLVFAFPLP